MAHTSYPDIRGIIFDLDGTLYLMRWYLKPLIFLRLYPHCLRLPRFLGVRDGFAGMEMDVEQRLFAAISDELAGREQISSSEAREWISNSFYPAFISVMPFFRFSRPGVKSLLKKCAAKGIRLAVLSDYGCVAQRLAGLGLPVSLFDTVSSCETAGALKPNPRPFLTIAESWGIEPKRVLVVGDRADTDGAAAANAGMQFWQVADTLLLPPGAMRWERICRRLKVLEKVTEVSP
jgi:FMN phosphatase YigB (HAD superfamily)